MGIEEKSLFKFDDATEELQSSISENYNSERSEVVETEESKEDEVVDTTAETSKDSVEEFKKDDFVTYEEKRVSIEANKVIDGVYILTIANSLIPDLGAYVYNSYAKKKGKKKIKARSLKLTKSELNSLEDIANEAMGQYNISGNPIFLLAVSLFTIYFSKFMGAKIEAEI